MSLTLICGRAGSGKSRFCLDKIREALTAEPEGTPLLLLLPEQATFQTERELAAAAGLNGFVRAHVLGFRRLAHRILSETGGASRPELTGLGRKLIISRLLTVYQDELTLFAGKTNRKGYADSLSSLIQEFKNYNIDPQQLFSAKSVFQDTALKNKLSDLALLFQGFECAMKESYLDAEDYLKLLAQKIPNAEFVKGATVWIDGFHWFTPAEYAVIEQLLLAAGEVYVTLCLDEPDSGRHQRETSLFNRQCRTRLHLKQLAQKHGIFAKDHLLEKTWRFEDNFLLRHVEHSYAVSGRTRWDGQDRSGFWLVEAANRRVEIEGMACDIIRLCREQGYRWRDIAVLLRDTESYSYLIERIFEDFGIPFFCDRKRSAGHHPLAELLRSVVEIYLENWSYEPVFRSLKTDLFPLTIDEVERLENYVLEFGIRGTRWTNDTHWTFRRRLSLNEDSELTEEQQHILEEINAIRRQVTAPLIKMFAQIPSQPTVAGITEILYNFLVDLKVAERLEKWAEEAEKNGELDQAKEHRQVWKGVIELFDQLAETCGDDPVTMEEFSQVLCDGLDGLELSLIPPGLDQVSVSSLEQTRIGSARAVYIPGANEGAFPMRGRGEGILTDRDREELRNAGLELAPGVKEEVFAERFLVYTAFTRASHYLWISFPLADEEGKALEPSMEIAFLKEITGSSLTSIAIEPLHGEERKRLAHPLRSLSALAVSLRRYKNGEQISGDWWDVYNWAVAKTEYRHYLRTVTAGLFHHNCENRLPPEIAGKLYCQKQRLRGSITRFESFRACPFKHFAQYGLRLKERALFRLKAPDLGQFLHAVLKEFGDCMARQERSWGSLTEAECRSICSEIVLALAPKLQNEILLSSEQYKHMLGRLQRRVERAIGRLVEYDRASFFKPVALEMLFGAAEVNSLPPLLYQLPDGTRVEVAGQIDRLDVADHNGVKYLMVMDYKSGNAGINSLEVYYGLRLQLLTYLLVALSSADKLFPGAVVEPAGVLYYLLKNPNVSGKCSKPDQEIVKEINRQLKMHGWLLKEPDIVRLIDATINGWSEFFKIGFGKNQDFYNACLGQLKTRDDFKQWLSHVEGILLETAKAILEGDIAIAPYLLERNSPCAYCPYMAVCQFDKLLPGNENRVLPALEDDEITVRLNRKEGGQKG